MPLKLNPTTGNLDLVNTDLGSYVKISGDTMTGDLEFPATGYIMKNTNGVRYRVTITTDGVLTTTPMATTPLGSPWLFLFGNI